MRLAARIYDRVPNDGLRRRSAERGFRGRIGSGNPDKDLLSVPIKEGGEICPKSVVDAWC